MTNPFPSPRQASLMQVEILDWRAPGWHAAAAMIEAHFHATHGAQVTLPALPLAGRYRGAGAASWARLACATRAGAFSARSIWTAPWPWN